MMLVSESIQNHAEFLLSRRLALSNRIRDVSLFRDCVRGSNLIYRYKDNARVPTDLYAARV